MFVDYMGHPRASWSRILEINNLCLLSIQDFFNFFTCPKKFEEFNGSDADWQVQFDIFFYSEVEGSWIVYKTEAGFLQRV